MAVKVVTRPRGVGKSVEQTASMVLACGGTLSGRIKQTASDQYGGGRGNLALTAGAGEGTTLVTRAGYHCSNLHSVFQTVTVEFRLFNGTLHAGKIKAYDPVLPW